MKHLSEFWLVFLIPIKNLFKGPLKLQEKGYFNVFGDIQWSLGMLLCCVIYQAAMIPFLQIDSYCVTRSNAVTHCGKSCCSFNSDADISLTLVCVY